MPYDDQLAILLRDALAGREGITERKMFGGICWMLDGNMLCGVEGKRYMFRIGRANEEPALARDGVSRMDFTGRPMRGLVWVEAEVAVADGLSDWIALASDFVQTLPKK